MKTIEFGFNIHRELPDVFGIIDDCFALSNIILKNLGDRNIVQSELDIVQAIYLSNHYKATESLISTAKLADAGLIGDLQTVARKLLEQAINLKYMSLDVEKRAPKFSNYSAIKLKSKIKNVLSNDNYSNELKESMNDLMPESDEAYTRAMVFFETDDCGTILKKYKKSWSGYNLSEMAEKCGLVSDYIYCFKIFSESTHAKTGILPDYFDLEKKSFGPTHQLSLAMKVLLEVLRLYLILTEFVIESFRIDLQGSIKSLRLRIDKLQGDPRLSDSTRITDL